MTIGLTVANQGDADAAAFFVSFLLSTDAALSNDDVPFAFCTYTNGEPAAASGACNFTDTFITSVAAGTYHVLTVADATFIVAERDEANNVTVMPGTVVVQ